MKSLSLSKFFKVSLVIAGLAFLTLMSVLAMMVQFYPSSQFSTQEIFFRSWESKTIYGEAVYNTIKFFKQPSQEIWMMNQSHLGFQASGQQLDRLAIVVKNRTADFYQLPPGDLVWSDDLPNQKINLKVDCRQCHSNGPRAIRPAPDFMSHLNFKEKATLFLLNLRIKFYGHLENTLLMQDEVLNKSNFETVTAKTCLHCHNGGDRPWNRGHLTRQQQETIRFLIQNKQMPPKGFFLSDFERNDLLEPMNSKKMSRNLHK